MTSQQVYFRVADITIQTNARQKHNDILAHAVQIAIVLKMQENMEKVEHLPIIGGNKTVKSWQKSRRLSNVRNTISCNNLIAGYLSRITDINMQNGYLNSGVY